MIVAADGACSAARTVAAAPDGRLPVLVITGFLGSGKTTLLNHLLRQMALRESAVAINEFGEAGLDGDFLAHDPARQAVLAGGCFCCSLGSGLGDELLALYSRAGAAGRPVERLVIEMSGIGRPAELIEEIIASPALSRLLRIERIVATVDALLNEASLREHPEAAAQIAIADRLVVTKRDLVPEAALAPLELRLASLNPRAPILYAERGEISADALLEGEDAFAHEPAPHDHAAHGAHGITSFTLRAEQPLPWRAVSRWLTGVKVACAADLLRVKGVLYLAGETAPVALHGVRHVFHRPEPLAHLAGTPPASRLVFITKGEVRERVEPGWRALAEGVAWA